MYRTSEKPMLGSSLLVSISFLAVLLCTMAGRAQPSASEQPAVLKITLENHAITPVTARFVTRAIARAEQQQARCLIIVLDTPGGLVEPTRDIVKAILHSTVPVVVYVAPTGARAASAGVFITMAGHVAAMAPGTNIGAAHPVQIGGLPGPPQQPAEKEKEKPNGEKTNGQEKPRATSPMEEKILNDTVAWARSLAELRGRNADWAARAVRESVSVTAPDAVKEGAVDFVAEDVNDLLTKLDGREVKLLSGTINLRVAGARVVDEEMWWGERLLAVVANPTLALLLLIFGFYGILFEFYSPGWGVSGTIGVICLVLGFFAMAVLPINYIGLALIVIALAMFVAEAFVVSYGFLTIGGVICLILGGVMLVDSPEGFMRVPLWLLIPISLATAAISFFLVGSVVKAHYLPAYAGLEKMRESDAVAEEEFRREGEAYRGRVGTHGEIWSAVSEKGVSKGQRLVVESREGLTLHVRPAEEGSESTS